MVFANEKKSILNVVVAIFFRITQFVGSFFVRRFLIQFIGNDVNGLNSLYLSLIGVLAVAELGIGNAITFCMYQPIVEGDDLKVSILYSLLQKVYTIIGAVIAIAGCVVMPFLPNLAKGYTSLGINLYFTFGLMLLSCVLTYFYGAKIALLNAYRNDYIATSITSIGQLLQQVLQIIVLFCTQSYVLYLVCRTVAVIVQWVFTDVIITHKYKAVIRRISVKIDKETKAGIIQNIKAMFMHRVGNVLVNTIDSIVISSFIGIAVLGKYSNYNTIMTSIYSVLVLFFSPLTSTIGHLYVESKEKTKQYFNFFYALNFSLGCVFFLGYYSVIDPLVYLLFGADLDLPKSVSFVIAVNYFIQFMRQSVLMFRDATGTFYYDRWKPMLEGICNLLLSVFFVEQFKVAGGDEFAVVGVLVATIVTNLLICHIIEPYVLFVHAFKMSPKYYYPKNYFSIFAFIILLFAFNFCAITSENKIVEMFANGSIAVIISMIPLGISVITNKELRHYGKVIVAHLSAKRMKG